MAGFRVQKGHIFGHFPSQPPLGNHHTYGHIRCVYSIFGREITIHTVIYGVFTVFLAGKSPYIGHIRCVYGIFGREIPINTVIYGVFTVFLAGKYHEFCHIRCVYGIFGREIPINSVIYGVFTVFLAGKSPYIRSYTVCIYSSGQPYTRVT